MNNSKELLDFSRAKKIFEKGFGFLNSLYYKENVFFHFSKIKDQEKRDLLNSLKRGIVIIFFISKLVDGKRKVDKVWLDIKDVPEHLINDFVQRLILELNDGIRNPFEIIDVLNQLRYINKLTIQNYRDITRSSKIKRNPSILLKLFSENENELKDETSIILTEWGNDYSEMIDSNDLLIEIFSR